MANRRLNPVDHPERWERLVTSIVTAAEPHLEERRRAPTVTTVLAGWLRPLLAAAAALVIFCATTLGILRGSRAMESVYLALAGSIMPEAFATWVAADHQPTVTELVLAVEGLPR